MKALGAVAIGFLLLTILPVIIFIGGGSTTYATQEPYELSCGIDNTEVDLTDLALPSGRTLTGDQQVNARFIHGWIANQQETSEGRRIATTLTSLALTMSELRSQPKATLVDSISPTQISLETTSDEKSETVATESDVYGARTGIFQLDPAKTMPRDPANQKDAVKLLVDQFPLLPSLLNTSDQSYLAWLDDVLATYYPAAWATPIRAKSVADYKDAEFLSSSFWNDPRNPVDCSEVEVQGVTPTGNVVSVNGIWVDASIAGNVRALLQAGSHLGLGGWGWRDSAAQIRLRKQNCGTSNYAIYEQRSSTCSPPTARPGSSQHERGLAIDFTCQGGQSISTRSSVCYRWLAENAGRFGLQNLPSEPWHWSVNGR